MATVEEVARDALASIDTDAAFLLAVKWVDKRYKQLASRARLRHLRETADIDLSGGGSEFDMPTDVVWYGTARYYAGSAYVRKVEYVPFEALEDFYPTRATLTGGPRVYSDKGLNAGATAKNIEVYPAAAGSVGEKLTISYWEEPSDLTISSDLPLGIEDHVLREGVLVDLYRYEAMRSMKAGNAEAAQLIARQQAEQQQIWEQSILDAMSRSVGVDDDFMFAQQQKRVNLLVNSPTKRFPRE